MNTEYVALTLALLCACGRVGFDARDAARRDVPSSETTDAIGALGDAITTDVTTDSALDATDGTLDAGVSPRGRPPTVLFSDLTSGPKTGGERGEGTILSIYGRRFGTSQGASTVTVGGGLVARTILWSDTRIAVAIGPAAATGPIRVTTSRGFGESSFSFVVRAGEIYCVDPAGNDSNTGSFGDCWRNLFFAKRNLNPGDIAYARGGVSAATEDDYGASIALSGGGTVAMPYALVAYPGEVATIIGGMGVFAPAISTVASDWVIAGFEISSPRGPAIRISSAARIRIVGNDITCGAEVYRGACVLLESAGSDVFEILGNRIHDTAPRGATEFAAVATADDVRQVRIAWNIFERNGGSDIRVAAELVPAAPFVIEGNTFADSRCGGTVVEEGDFGRDLAVFRNNQCAGLGCSCLATTNGPRVGRGSGALLVLHNTIVDLAPTVDAISHGTDYFGVVASYNAVRTRGYLSVSGAGGLSGEQNLWFGSGRSPPTQTRGNITLDPLFESAAAFCPGPMSPLIDSATASTTSTDGDGVARPQGVANDIGTCERW